MNGASDSTTCWQNDIETGVSRRLAHGSRQADGRDEELSLQHRAHHAGRLRLAHGGRLDDEDLRRARGLERGRRHEPDRARPEHRRGVARLEPGQPHRVVGDGERLDERAEVGRDVAERVRPPGADDALLGEPALLPVEPDEAELAADVVAADRAGGALAADVVGLDGDPVAHRDVRDAVADLGDDAGELVAHHHRHLLAGQRVRRALRRDEDRALEVLVQVGAADAAPLDVDLDLPGADLRLRDVVDADVAGTVETRSLHVGTSFTRQLGGCSRGPAAGGRRRPRARRARRAPGARRARG